MITIQFVLPLTLGELSGRYPFDGQVVIDTTLLLPGQWPQLSLQDGIVYSSQPN